MIYQHPGNVEISGVFKHNLLTIVLVQLYWTVLLFCIFIFFLF